jgi:hypothetical protein
LASQTAQKIKWKSRQLKAVVVQNRTRTSIWEDPKSPLNNWKKEGCKGKNMQNAAMELELPVFQTPE